MKNTKTHSIRPDKINKFLPYFKLNDCVSILSEQLNKTIKELNEDEDTDELEFIIQLLGTAIRVAKTSIERIKDLNNK